MATDVEARAVPPTILTKMIRLIVSVFSVSPFQISLQKISSSSAEFNGVLQPFRFTAPSGTEGSFVMQGSADRISALAEEEAHAGGLGAELRQEELGVASSHVVKRRDYVELG
jgi:hypothetical protein